MTKIERHEVLCKKLHDIYVKKNHDYGDSFVMLGISQDLSRMRV